MVALFCYFAFPYFDFVKVFTIQTDFSIDAAIFTVLIPFFGSF